MATYMVVKDGNGTLVYLNTTGSGTSDDPYVSHFAIDSGSVVITNLPTTPSAVFTYNLTLVSTNTEYGLPLPSSTLMLAFRNRTSGSLRYAWITGKVAAPTAPWETLEAGAEYQLSGVVLASGSLYFATATAGQVVEVEAWQ